MVLRIGTGDSDRGGMGMGDRDIGVTLTITIAGIAGKDTELGCCLSVSR
jgi:hypothetical protein